MATCNTVAKTFDPLIRPFTVRLDSGRHRVTIVAYSRDMSTWRLS